MKKLTALSGMLLLSGCVTSDAPSLSQLNPPTNWTVHTDDTIEHVDASSLKDWWLRFNDPTLNVLIDETLVSSPDRLIAEAKIAEARGLRKTSRSALFPQIGFSGSKGREDTGSNAVSYPDDFYEAGFDASFEIDVFGKNRNNASAADSQLQAVEDQYNDVSLTLIGEVARNYIDYRAAQNQLRIAQKNLKAQEETLKLVEDMFRLGSAPKLDVERTLNLVNTTRASIPEYQRQTDNARLRLVVLTGKMPHELTETLQLDAEIPTSDALPVLMTPAQVLSARPDIRAAEANLNASTSTRKATSAEIFPTFSLSGFYGFADNALASTVQPWNFAIGTAVSLLNFGRIEGRIDAAEAREVQAYQGYRKTVLGAVSEVETALTDYSHIRNQYVSLNKAYQSASKALELSQKLYKEGEISFLDVLDAQRTVNNAEAATITAKASQAQSLIRLYKSLGVY